MSSGAHGPRVVSLVPSSTETLIALGADVVACTRFCEQPSLVHVGGTKNPDIAAIVGLAPDLVVLDREENRREDAEALTAAGLDLFVSDVRTVADAVGFVGDLAARVGRPSPPLSVGVAEPTSSARSVFVPIWRRPWMSINRSTYGASVLAHIGVRLVTADCDDEYPQVQLEEICALRPSAVLVPSEPYDFHDHHLAELAVELGHHDHPLPVVRIDGQDLFWWGIRTPAAIVRLRDAIRSVSLLQD